MQIIPKSCPQGNMQDEFHGVEALVIHGPAWTNWMPFDTHARSVVLPWLRENQWIIRVSQGLRRIEAITPWRPEVLQ